MRAVKIGDGNFGIDIAVKRRQIFQRAELLVSAVSTIRCPVVVGLKVQMLILIGAVIVAHIDHIRPAGLHLGKNVIQHGIFVHHGGIGRQHFRVDIAGRRCQQKSDPAGVALGKVCDGTDIFPQLLLSIRTDGKQLGEHPAIFAV